MEHLTYLMGFEDSVGHYCTLDTAIKIVESNKVRLNPMANVNDPWESTVRRFGHFKPNSDEEVAMCSVAEMLPKSVNLNLKLFCTTDNWKRPQFDERVMNPWQTPELFDDPEHPFTDSVTDSRFFNQPRSFVSTENNCWSKMRMWDQYGDRRKGACLVFDRHELGACIFQQFPYASAGHVLYTTVTQRYSTTQALAFEPGIHPDNDDNIAVRKHIEQYIKELALLKDEDWSNENEFRYIVFDDDSEQWAEVNFASSLKVIILGLEYGNALLRPMNDAAGSTPVYETEWNAVSGQLRLSSEPVGK